MHVLHPQRTLALARTSPQLPGMAPQQQAQYQADLARSQSAQYQAELVRQNAHVQTQAAIAMQQQSAMAAHAQAEAESARLFRGNASKQVDWRLLDDEGGIKQNVSKDADLIVGGGKQPLINVTSESGNACTVAISIDVEYNPGGAALPAFPDADVLIYVQWGTSRGLHSAEISAGNGTTFSLSGSMFQLSAQNTGNVPMRVAAGIGVGPIAIEDEPKRVYKNFNNAVALAVPKYGYKFSATRLPLTNGLVVRQYTSIGTEVQLSSDTLAVGGSSVGTLVLSPLCRAITILAAEGAYTRLDPFFYLSL